MGSRVVQRDKAIQFSTVKFIFIQDQSVLVRMIFKWGRGTSLPIWYQTITPINVESSLTKAYRMIYSNDCLFVLFFIAENSLEIECCCEFTILTQGPFHNHFLHLDSISTEIRSCSHSLIKWQPTLHMTPQQWFRVVIKFWSDLGPLLLTWINFNSLRPSDAYMCQYNMPTLVEIMACRLVGTKPFSEPILEYC